MGEILFFPASEGRIASPRVEVVVALVVDENLAPVRVAVHAIHHANGAVEGLFRNPFGRATSPPPRVDVALARALEEDALVAEVRHSEPRLQQRTDGFHGSSCAIHHFRRDGVNVTRS